MSYTIYDFFDGFNTDFDSFKKLLQQSAYREKLICSLVGDLLQDLGSGSFSEGLLEFLVNPYGGQYSRVKFELKKEGGAITELCDFQGGE